MTWPTLTDAALAVLGTAHPLEKAAVSRRAAAAWRGGGIPAIGLSTPPDRPARPSKPELRAPRDMPKRKAAGSLSSRIALLHAVAHIELNAIDLSWDIVARFAPLAEEHADPTRLITLPRAFFDDWVGVGDDEARHHMLVQDRLAALGATYGDLPAHDGLWRASRQTAHDIGARLAIVPMVFEARGLDVTPGMVAGLTRAEDHDSAAILQLIHDEEIGHVAAGRRWFDHVCALRGVPAAETWRSLVRTYYGPALKPPINVASRTKAGLQRHFYEPLATELPALD